MTQREHPVIKWIVDTSKVVAAVCTIGGAAFVGWGFVWGPVGKWITAVNAVTDRSQANLQAIRSLEGRIAAIGHQIRVLAAPEITEYSPSSKFLSNCVAGQPCTVAVRVRRWPGAEACVLDQAATRLNVMSYDDFEERVAPRVNAGSTYDVGATFETHEIIVGIPSSMPIGPGELRIETGYTRCPWQSEDGEPPAMQLSPPIPLNIVP